MVGMLGVNPCTAYRMLKDFADLKKGDWIIQNGSNSAVGQGIIQLCRIWGINTLNIVREREGIETVKEELKALGANITVTDKEFRSSEFQENLKNQGITFKVGFNCVGGKLVNDMAKVLENKANLVTYGGMSREPVTLSTSNLIFKQINFTGYWMAEWNESAKLSERKEMWTALLKLMASGEFKLPGYEVFNFSDCNEESFEKIKQSLTLSNKGGSSKLKKLIQFD
ncbi:NAD(P)-binding protein [Conidiobolus coronatus NRRL 28638]|uniref:NAD(P)-binding protein n=1 Tax=Conidiobolus coronatus (strain ATCC 28846 / CBS 209.66 / NRRL 28638) TaxID=796925 RepID=A0A137NXD1_CONC2|nr:NAD(P)-binding protein [Conidiobolus coronatus NRRL 28638]|eukprot:KXN67314.1 NAD(P)-binding protein [Conidiobolus coronatus NRRL 28638]